MNTPAKPRDWTFNLRCSIYQAAFHTSAKLRHAEKHWPLNLWRCLADAAQLTCDGSRQGALRYLERLYVRGRLNDDEFVNLCSLVERL